MDRRAPVGYSLWGCKKLDTTEQLTRIHMFLIVNFFFLLGCGDRGGCDACYNLPALLLLAVIIGLSLAHLPEWAVVLASFAVLALYILILYLRRRKVESRFTLTITPNF